MIRKRIWLVVLGSAFALGIEAMQGDDLLDDEPGPVLFQRNYCIEQKHCANRIGEWLPQVVDSRIKEKSDLDEQIFSTCRHGDTNMAPLLVSSSSDNFLCITKKLLRHGANPNIIGVIRGTTLNSCPLLGANFGGGEKTIKALLKAGANPNLDQSILGGRTMLHWACIDLMQRSIGLPYGECVTRQQTKIVKLLLQYGADPNGGDAQGRRPLFELYFDEGYSPSERFKPLIILLLLYGADIALKDTDGNDLIAYAEARGHSRGAQFLRDWRDGRIKLEKKKLR